MSALRTPMSMHNDVMKAHPDTDEGKQTLYRALKDRGASEFKNKRLDCAVKLYARALEFAASEEDKATIHCNLSLVHAGMKNGQKAVQAADQAIAINAANPKAHFRRGQALVVLNKIPDSHSAFEEAAKLAGPEEKIYAKGLRKSQKRLDNYVPDLDPEHTAKQAAEKKKPAIPASSIVSSKASATSASSSKSPSTTTALPKAKTNTAGKAAGDMRGYKIVNGKKTSYFHHEMTEEEKRLIGDITPQRIDPKAQAEAAKPKVAVEGMSEWNSKGTFEDRDFMPWAKQQLKELVVGLEVPCGTCTVKATKVSDVKGLCSIAFIQKRKRFLFELSFKTEFVADASGVADSGAKAPVSVSKGELTLEQFCHDDPDSDDLVRTYTTKKAAAASSDAQAIKRSVGNPKGDFYKALVERLQTFRQRFFAL